jgi:cyclic pyranopterin monophosphate synthase
VLTHIDQNNNPTMVDVTNKSISVRMAEAQTLLTLPPELKDYFIGEEIVLKKGPVFQTAIIAGTMAVKRTHEMIPFCHQIPVESCKIEISHEDLKVRIVCRVKTTFKTGVEMEALHGAMLAALTIYDMCKAVSHNIVIHETKLLAKTGGKRTIMDRPVYGLVLTGGKSQRMGTDKALIDYKGKPHAEYIFDILENHCDEVYLSARQDQWKGTSLQHLPAITDKYPGTIGGMLSAFEAFPEVNWVIVACDLVHFNEKTLLKLLSEASSEVSTCFRHKENGFPEPLCAFYRPGVREFFSAALKNDIRCPVKVLKNLNVKLLDQDSEIDLANINTPEERHEFH